MRIALVITRGDDIGGAQQYVLSLARMLLADRHQLLVITGQSGVFSDLLRDNHISTISLPHLSNSMNPINDVQAVRGLVRALKEFDADLISLHSSKAGMLGRLAARLTRKPVVFTVHGWSFTPGVREPQRTVYQIIERSLANWTDRIICVSDHSRSLALSRGFPADRIMTIHNGIECLHEGDAEQDSEPNSVVMTARFADPKDQISLVRAACHVPGLNVHFIGDGPMMDDCIQVAEDLGIKERVHFHGYVKDVARQLERYGAFVLLSRHEGFPLSTLEAMRAGLPVIVSKVGGAPEAVIDGVNGFVVDNDDQQLLVDCLRDLLTNPELRSSMGRASRERFLNKFTLDSMYEKTIEVYQNAVNRAG